MIQVSIRPNVERLEPIVAPETTVRQLLEEYEIDYTRQMISIDGVKLGVGDFDKSFNDLGITERCFLSGVTKTDNA